MTTSRRELISHLHEAALQRPPEERNAFLRDACDGDPELHQELESLLRYEAAAAGFLEIPAASIVAYGSGPPLEMVGRQLGPYQIVAPLGSGGMGEVYRARDTKLGREVAIKILPAQFTADPDRRARLSREARLLATLNHPHIGAIYGVEEGNGLTALVLELVEGPTLAQRLEGGPLPLDAALAIAGQIAEALAATHERGLIHRDLKPSNIVLQRESAIDTSDVQVKVLDFGLAKPIAPERSVDGTQPADSFDGTVQGRILGTPSYMSPEQARGLAVDRRSDVWAFGCVLFEMLTGLNPFAGPTVTDTLTRILEREPDWAQLPTQTPASIRRLLRRCLRKDPEKRLRDISDARMEIDEQDLEPNSASPTGRRVGPLASILVTLLILGALMAALFWLDAQRAVPGRLVASLEPPPDARFYYRNGAIALAPDGSHVASVVSIGNGTQLWVRRLEALEWQPVQGTEGARIPFWKADSREVGFFANGKLKAVPVRQGAIPYEICDAPEGYAFYGGATWNRDDVIVFVSRTFTLLKVSAKGGPGPAPLTTLKPGETSHRWPSFLPDGQHFLYLALRQVGEAGELQVGSLDGAAPLAIARSESNAVYSHGHLFFVQNGQLVARPFDVTRLRATGDPFGLTAVGTIELQAGLGHFADFSAASGVVAYRATASDRMRRLSWRDRTGKVMGTVGDKAQFFNLDLSPEGHHLAVSTKTDPLINSDIWTVDLRTEVSTRLTTDQAQEYDPRWSPDGNWIAFLSNRTAGQWNAFRRRSNGSGKDEPLVPSTPNAFVTSWTADGRSIVYTNNTADIWVLPLDTDREPHSLRATEGRKTTVVMSPDGRWIAYASQKSGRREIYARAFPDGDTDHRVSRDGGIAPRWSADGHEIFYLSPDAMMMSARVETARGFNVAAPESLFQTGLEELPNQFPYAVGRDGRFLMPMPVDPRGPAPITVLFNWDGRLAKQ